MKAQIIVYALVSATTLCLLPMILPHFSHCVARLVFEQCFVNLLTINDKKNYKLGTNLSFNDLQNHQELTDTFSLKKINTTNLAVTAMDEKKLLELKKHIKTNFNDAIRKQIYCLVIYNTLALHGNTLTLNHIRFILESQLTIGEKSLKEHNEVLGVDLAFHFIKSIVGNDSISNKDVCEIHKRLLGHLNPLKAGLWKSNSGVLEDYIRWFNSKEKSDLHPITVASLVLLKFVQIQPFEEGNHITGLLIMYLALLRSGYPLIVIDKNDKQLYFNSLNRGLRNDPDVFVGFVTHSMTKTIDSYLALKPERNKEIESV